MARLLPLLVYKSGVLVKTDIYTSGDWTLSDGQTFLMSPLYSYESTLGDFGAVANFIGQVNTVSGIRLPSFRKPKENEVIAYHPDSGSSGCLRWSGTAWEVYRTLPQKALDNQGVFELFDESGIYDYYAFLIGCLHAQHMEDTKEILGFLNPKQVPKQFLQHLAATFGAEDITTIDLTTDEFRAMLAGVIALHRDRGTPGSVVVGLRNLGYIGLMKEVWVDPSDPANNYEEVTPGSSAVTTGYYPSSSVILHITDLDGEQITPNDDEAKRIAKYLKRNILPAHTQIREFASP